MSMILVDFDAVFCRAWYATNQVSAEHVVRGAVSKVRQLLAPHPSGIVCADTYPTWRHELSAGYKSERPRKPPEAGKLRRAAIDELASVGIAVVRLRPFEADDLLASACKWALPKWGRVVVATMDKDLHQLLADDRVEILTLGRPEVRTASYVRERYGIGPELLGDWLALVGDAVDSIPGVPGVGPKAATALLQRFGGLFGVLDAARDEKSKLTPRGRAALLDNQVQLALSRRLVALRDDAPVCWSDYAVRFGRGQKSREVVSSE